VPSQRRRHWPSRTGGSIRPAPMRWSAPTEWTDWSV